MTEYEIQSLAIAKQGVAVANAQFWVYFWADIIAGGALLAAVIGGVIAYKNIRLVIEQLELSRWGTLLVFEQDMASRRAAFHALAADMKKNPDTPVELLQERFDDAKESYFNALERLASSILNGHFPPTEMKQDYREVITEVVRGFPYDFATGTRYRKVVKLFNRWEDQA